MTDNLSDTIIDIADIEQNLLDNPHLLSFWSNGHKPTSTTSYIDSAIIDGELTYFETQDKNLIDSLTSFSSPQQNGLIGFAQKVKNFVTANITSNPAFYLPNFARDTVSASALSKNGFVPIVSSLKGMYHFVTKNKVYKDFMASGGGYGTQRINLGKETKAYDMLKVNRGFSDVFRNVADAFHYGADMFEYGTRLGEFELSQKNGSSNMQSAFDAREISTDFAIKGSDKTATTIMSTIPFLKASINGLDKTVRHIFEMQGQMKIGNAFKLKDDLGNYHKEKIKLYTIGGGIALGTLALYNINKDDERYKKLTKEQRLLNWNFFIGDKHIKVPRPYDIGFIFSAIPEIIADYTYTKNGKKGLDEFLWGLKSMAIIPDAPAIISPVVEHISNKNWLGNDIVPQYMKNISDKSLQKRTTTPQLYQQLGVATNSSPLLIEHYSRGFLGLTAKMIENLTEDILWNKKEWGGKTI
jgi:hypothetical protein